MTLALTTFCYNLNQHKRYKKHQTLQGGEIKTNPLAFQFRPSHIFLSPHCSGSGAHSSPSLTYIWLSTVWIFSFWEDCYRPQAEARPCKTERKTLPGVTDFRLYHRDKGSDFSLFLSSLGTELLGIHKTRRATKWQCM